MALKNYILIIATLVIIQNASGIPIDPKQNDLDRMQSDLERKQNDLLQHSTQAVDELNRIVASRMAHSIDSLDKNMRSLDDFRKSTIKTVTELLQSSTITSLKQILETRVYALNRGKDPKDCIGNNEEDIKKKPVEKINEMVSCNSEHMDKPREEMKKAIEEVSKLMQVVYDVINKLTSCNGDNSGTDCYVEVLNEATKQTAELPQQIASLIIEAQNHVDKAREEIITCTLRKANEVQNDIAKKTQDISNCVEEL